MSDEGVGNLTDGHRKSIGEWIRIWQNQGLDALLEVRFGTNKSVLENHAASIKELFSRQPPRSIAEAIIKIKELTGIERSHSRLRAFMKRYDFRYLKTGHIPAKLNTTQQHDWVERTLKPVIKAA